MRGILFKPIHVPGFRRSEPCELRSLRFTIILMALSVASLSALLGGIYVTTYTVTFIWTVTTEPIPKSVEELPLWTIPVCVLSPVLVFVAIAWRFRLMERFARFIREEDKRDAS